MSTPGDHPPSTLRKACEALAERWEVYIPDEKKRLSLGFKGGLFLAAAELRIALSAAEEPAKVTRGNLHFDPRDALRDSPAPSDLRDACEALIEEADWKAGDYDESNGYREVARWIATELRDALAAAPEADRDRATLEELRVLGRKLVEAEAKPLGAGNCVQRSFSYEAFSIIGAVLAAVRRLEP